VKNAKSWRAGAIVRTQLAPLAILHFAVFTLHFAFDSAINPGYAAGGGLQTERTPIGIYKRRIAAAAMPG
jgi:hypothetical protein